MYVLHLCVNDYREARILRYRTAAPRRRREKERTRRAESYAGRPPTADLGYVVRSSKVIISDQNGRRGRVLRGPRAARPVAVHGPAAGSAVAYAFAASETNV